jgi:DsbC/DsbD-like thiol-disulfide interchange protein
VHRFSALVGVLSLLAVSPAQAAGPVFSAAAAWQGAPPAPGVPAVLRVEVTVQPGWHVNSNAPLDPYLIPTSIRLGLPTGWSADKPRFPASRRARFAFSEDELAVFEGPSW